MTSSSHNSLPSLEAVLGAQKEALDMPYSLLAQSFFPNVHSPRKLPPASNHLLSLIPITNHFLPVSTIQRIVIKIQTHTLGHTDEKLKEKSYQGKISPWSNLAYLDPVPFCLEAGRHRMTSRGPCLPGKLGASGAVVCCMQMLPVTSQ